MTQPDRLEESGLSSLPLWQVEWQAGLRFPQSPRLLEAFIRSDAEAPAQGLLPPPRLGREEKKATKAHSNKGFISQFSIAISAFLPARLNFRLSLEEPGGFGDTACSCHSGLNPGLWEEGHSSVLERPLRPLLISGSHHRVGGLLATVVTVPGSLWELGDPGSPSA